MSAKIEQGTLVIITKGHDKYPEGKVVKVLSYNTPQKEYMVTDILESKPSSNNPYIMESDEGFKMTKEEFDTNEFIPIKHVKQINYNTKYNIPFIVLLTINTVVALSCLWYL